MEIMTERLKFGDIIDDILRVFPEYGEMLAKEFDDDIDFIRKSEASSIIETIEGDRVIIGRITSHAIDRDGEVVLPDGGDFSDYAKNRVVLWSHDYGGSLFGGTQYQLPHARNMWLRQFPTRNSVEVRAGTQYATKEMNAFGDQVYQYRLAKWPLGYSIGFIPIQILYPDDNDWGKTLVTWKRRLASQTGQDIAAITEPKMFHAKWKMLEYSDVKIPANQDAVQLMISKGILDEKEREKYTLKTDDFYEENSIDIMTATKEEIARLSSEIIEMRKQIVLLEEMIYHEDEQEEIEIDSEAIARAFGQEPKEIDISELFRQGIETIFK